MGFIYMITNTINGKRYIGQTHRRLKKRIYEHLNVGETKRRYLQKAMAKYGKESFTWQILQDGILLQEELDYAESEMIKKYKTMHPKGYNLTAGGNGGRPSEATKQLLSFINKERARSVVCMNTGRVYESVRAAARRHNVSSGAIIRCCNNPAASEHGRRWRYANEEANAEIVKRHLEDVSRREEERASKAVAAKAKKNTWNKEWHDEVRRRKEVMKAQADARRAEIDAAGGYRQWCRQEAYKRMQAKDWWDKYRAATPERSKPKEIRCIETGEQYSSISRAAKAMGVSQKTLSEVVNTPGRTCRGKHYEIAANLTV